AGTGRGMAGKVDHAAEQPLLRVPDADYPYLGVGRPSGLDEVRVALPRVSDSPAVTHLEAAVEGHCPLQPPAATGLCANSGIVCLADGFHDGVFDLFQVF